MLNKVATKSELKGAGFCQLEMSKAFMQIWVCEPIADGESYDIVSTSNKGITFSSRHPFSFDNSQPDQEDLFQPILKLSLHDNVRIADLPDSNDDGAFGEIELPKMRLKTNVGNHVQKTAWCTVKYDVSLDLSVNYPCFNTIILSVTLPYGSITMSISLKIAYIV